MKLAKERDAAQLLHEEHKPAVTKPTTFSRFCALAQSEPRPLLNRQVVAIRSPLALG